MRSIVGIDPGLDGGIAFVDATTGRVQELVVMPTAGKELDLPAIVRLLQGVEVLEEIWLEKVSATPARRVKGKPIHGQGVASAFKFGTGWGSIRGIAAALGHPLFLVSPGVWQRTQHAGASGATAKERSVAAALSRYPRVDFLRSARGKVPHAGKVDALLIAEHGRRDWMRRSA